MLKLYHGDTSVCSQKVRLVLEELGLDWTGVMLNLAKGDQFDPDYLKLNPNAVVPTLDHDGQILIESGIIIDYLDSLSEPRKLLPSDPMQRAKARLWILEGIEFHYSVNSLTFSTSGRLPMLKQTPEQREARYASIPDLLRSAKLRDLVENGAESIYVRAALNRFTRMFAEINEALVTGPWLMGADYSLADAAVTPYIYRLECLGLEGLWESRYPRVTEWWQGIKSRPNFQKGIMTYMDPERVAAQRKVGYEAVSNVEDYRPLL